MSRMSEETTQAIYENITSILEQNSSDLKMDYEEEEEEEFFVENYVNMYLLINITICIFGVLTNIINMIIFTRKKMVSPINMLLTALAAADLTFVLSWGFFQCICYRSENILDPEFQSQWNVLIIISEQMIFLFIPISIWLTVVLGIWRFIGIRFPIKSRNWLNKFKAKLIILIVFVWCVIFRTSFVLTVNLTHSSLSDDTYYYSRMVINLHNGILPITILTVFTTKLVIGLHRARSRRKELTETQIQESADDKTTQLLLGILVLFIFTHGPNAIIGFIVGILKADVTSEAFTYWYDLAMIGFIINSSVNIIWYLIMSNNFRTIFMDMFIPKFKK